jgi:hypothetical protein
MVRTMTSIPIVTITAANTGLPTIGRSAIRSITAATIAASTAAMMTATKKFSPMIVAK